MTATLERRWIRTPAELFPGFDAGPLAGLLSDREAKVSEINAVSKLMGERGRAGLLRFFLRGNGDENTRVPERLWETEGAVKALDAKCWEQALELTDVLQVMPQTRREEWWEQIRKLEVPPFEPVTVRETLAELLEQRHRFFAEKVDGVWQALSHEHVTNSPKGFGKRMILAHMHDGGFTHHTRVGYLGDLRAVIAKFMGTEEPSWYSASRLVEFGLRRRGEWFDVDGGAWRLRVYLKGTAHIEIHPDMAWRLNAVLHSLHPTAIAAEYRTAPTVRRSDIRPIQRPLAAAVLAILADLRICDHGQGLRWEVSSYRHQERGKEAWRQAREVLVALGASVEGSTPQRLEIEFDFPARTVIDEVVASGCVPDARSHQFYPTPPELAQRVFELAEIGPEDTVLEPSAGTGAITELLPEDRLTCVEISRLHAAILRSRMPQAEVIEGDFLNWRPGRVFNRVVMNPPFAEGRHQAHVAYAATLVHPGGRLVAILPASQRGKEPCGAGWKHDWSGAIEHAFAGTSMAVAIMVADRRSEP